MGTAAAALGVTLLLRRHIEPNHIQVFLAAVIVSGLYGGLGPGLLTTALSSVCLCVFFGSPGGRAWILEPMELTGLSLFIAIAVFITILNEARYRAVGRHETLLLRAQQARTEADTERERTRAILESIRDGFMAFDGQLRFSYLNQKAAELTTRPMQELLGAPVQGLFMERAERELCSQLQWALEKQTTLHFDLFDPVHEAWLEMDAYPSKDGVSVFFRDVTERKHSEAALRESEERYRSLVAAMTSVVWTADCEGRFDVPQTSWAAYTGQDWHEHAGLGWIDMIHPEDRDAMNERLRGALKRRSLFESDARVWHARTGQYRYCAARAAPLITPDGRVREWVGTLVDMDDRKRAERTLAEQAMELARSNRELEQFAYVASHDLQEPLRMVTTYTQLLSKRFSGQLGREADEFIGFAQNGVQRMYQLINDLLTYSRVGSGGKGFATTSCEPLLKAALEDLTVAIRESGAIITHDPLPTLWADPSQLVQVFQNLLGNAIKFRRSAPPRIHIGAAASGSEWVFSISDNGVGIAPQYLERIFVLFKRLHQQDEYPGTGIGLAVCKKIVERHGGCIWAESETGSGSTFRFTLPSALPNVGGMRRTRDVGPRREARSLSEARPTGQSSHPSERSVTNGVGVPAGVHHPSESSHDAEAEQPAEVIGRA